MRRILAIRAVQRIASANWDVPRSGRTNRAACEQRRCRCPGRSVGYTAVVKPACQNVFGCEILLRCLCHHDGSIQSIGKSKSRVWRERGDSDLSLRVSMVERSNSDRPAGETVPWFGVKMGLGGKAALPYRRITGERGASSAGF